MNKYNLKKTAYSLILASILSVTACSNTNESKQTNTNNQTNKHKYEVEINNPVVEETKEEQVKKLTWYKYDAEKQAYKVNIEKMVSEQYNFDLNDKYVEEIIEKIYLYLGNDIYMYNPVDNKETAVELYNLSGTKLHTALLDDGDLHIYYKFDNVSISHTATPGKSVFTVYSNECKNGIYEKIGSDTTYIRYHFNEDSYILVSLIGQNLYLSSEKGSVKIEGLSDDEFATIQNALDSYSERNDLENFFIEYNDLLLSYVEEIKDINSTMYNDLCGRLENKNKTLNL